MLLKIISLRAFTNIPNLGFPCFRISEGFLGYCGYDTAIRFYNDPRISLVVNLCQRFGSAKELKGYRVPIFMYPVSENSSLEALKPILLEAFYRIHSTLSQGGLVLIHCNEGLIRSPGFLQLYRILVENINPATVETRSKRVLEALKDVKTLDPETLAKFRAEIQARISRS